MSRALNKIEDFKRTILSKLYYKCTERQRHVFNRMYGSLNGVRDDQIDWAIQQCEKTIKANKKKEGGG